MHFLFELNVRVLLSIATPLLVDLVNADDVDPVVQSSVNHFVNAHFNNWPPIPNGTLLLTSEDIERCYNETSTANSKNDPDIKRNITEIIVAHGYAVETHKVTTEDGYILTLFRIPYKKHENLANRTKKVVLLSHGLMGSSAQWIIQNGSRNLAMKLVDAGYDVWLNNQRGCSFSRQHISLTEDEREYWDFSWHEMGIYDVPAIIDYILITTKKTKLSYIGHSQGATQLLVALSERESYNEKIEIAFLLSPIAYLTHSTSVLKQLAPLGYNIQYLTDPLLGGKLQADALDKYFHTSLGSLCANSGLTCPLCGNLYSIAFGYDGPQIDYARLNVMLSKSLDAASTKCVVHYAQNMIHSPPSFRQFDYTLPANNEKRYGPGVTQPPAYNLSKVTTRVIGFYAASDKLGNPQDCAITFSKLGHNPGNELVRVNWTLFHHLDFSFAKDADLLVYNYILKVLKS